MADSNQLVASIARDRIAIDLKTEDLCFLAALHLRGVRSGDNAFGDDILISTFGQAFELVNPGAENLRVRATHAIQRLADQRMLVRVDSAGVTHAGEYALGPLGAAIVGHYLVDDALTRENLTLLTRLLIVQLQDIQSASRAAANQSSWNTDVAEPLRVTVRELLAGIDRRQRGLDHRQAELQKEISELLNDDWFSAVDRCLTLLDGTTATLNELNEVLLRDTHHMQILIQDIAGAADDAGAHEVLVAVQQVEDGVARVAAWGTARQRAWSEFHQYLHGYIRNVVRLDPERAQSQRLRDRIGRWAERPYFLTAVHAVPCRVLRPIQARIARPPVARPRREHSATITKVTRDVRPFALKAAVTSALESGLTTLAAVLQVVLPEVAPDQRFVVIGRVDMLVAATRYVRVARPRAWREVGYGLEVEDWQLEISRPQRPGGA